MPTSRLRRRRQSSASRPVRALNGGKAGHEARSTSTPSAGTSNKLHTFWHRIDEVHFEAQSSGADPVHARTPGRRPTLERGHSQNSPNADTGRTQKRGSQRKVRERQYSFGNRQLTDRTLPMDSCWMSGDSEDADSSCDEQRLSKADNRNTSEAFLKHNDDDRDEDDQYSEQNVSSSSEDEADDEDDRVVAFVYHEMGRNGPWPPRKIFTPAVPPPPGRTSKRSPLVAFWRKLGSNHKTP
jgi:hypothetical protein